MSFIYEIGIIEFAPAQDVRVFRRGDSATVVFESGGWTNLPFVFTTARYSEQGETSEHGIAYKQSLSVSNPDMQQAVRTDLRNRELVLRLTCADGTVLIWGTNYNPVRFADAMTISERVARNSFSFSRLSNLPALLENS